MYINKIVNLSKISYNNGCILIFLMYVKKNIDLAFDSIEFIMRNINNGWFIRYLHSNGASSFIFYLSGDKLYNSYIFLSHSIWFLGIIRFLLILVTSLRFLHIFLCFNSFPFSFGKKMQLRIVFNNIIDWILIFYLIFLNYYYKK